jgi:hypothetical protein
MADLAQVAQAVAVAAQGPPSGLLDRLCAACVSAMAVEGAAISVMAEVNRPMASSVSDSRVSRFEELQFTLGEGPAVAAFRACAPAFVEDLLAPVGSWPVFAAEAAAVAADTGWPIRSVLALPLQLGSAQPLGVLDLYKRESGAPDAALLKLARVAVDTVAMALYSATLAASEEGEELGWLQYAVGSRVDVDQAVGMVMAQADLASEGALARIRAYAFLHGQNMDEVARAVIARELRFTEEPR